MRKMKSFTPEEGHGDHDCENCGGSGIAAVKIQGMEGHLTPVIDAAIAQTFFMLQHHEDLAKGQHLFLMGKTQPYFAAILGAPWQENIGIADGLIGMGHAEIAQKMGPPEFLIMYAYSPRTWEEHPDSPILKGPGDKTDAGIYIIARDELVHAFFTFDGNGREEYVSVSRLYEEDEQDEASRIIYQELARLQGLLNRDPKIEE